jgi:hypothetical protein
MAMLPAFSGCASNNGSLQSRIEGRLHAPDPGNVQMGPATYNWYSKNFEQPWPFGPYSD